MTDFNERTKNLVSSTYADDRLIIAKHLMDKIKKAEFLKRCLHDRKGAFDFSELTDEDEQDLFSDLQTVINTCQKRLSALV